MALSALQPDCRGLTSDGVLHALLALLVLLILPLPVSVPTPADHLLLPRGGLLRAITATTTYNLDGTVTWS